MNFKNLEVWQILTDFFEYRSEKYFYSIQNIWIDTDFNDTENIFRLSFDLAKYSQEFEADDIEEAICSLTDLVDYVNNQNERKTISLRVPIVVIDKFKKLAKEQ